MVGPCGTHQFGQKNVANIILGIVLRAEEGWLGDLMIADYEVLQESEAHRNPGQKIQKLRSIRDRTSQISVCKRNSWTCWSSETTINSGGKP